MTLFRAMARAFCVRLLTSVSASLALFFVLGLVDSLGHPRAGAAEAYTSALLVISTAVDQVCLLAPALAFLSALATGTAWAQSGELEAAFCSGRSPWGMAFAMALTSFVLGVLSFGYQESIGLRAAAWRHKLEADSHPTKRSLAQALARHTAWVSAGHYVLHLPHRATRETERRWGADRAVAFREPTLYDFRGGRLEAILTGDLLVERAGSWRLLGACAHALSQEGIDTSVDRPVDLPLSGEDLMALSADPSAEPLVHLLRLIKRRERAGMDTIGIRLVAFRRLVPVLMSPFWVLFAAPLALAPGRKKNLAQNLGRGTGIVALTLALGHVARLLALARVIDLTPAILLEPILGALLTYGFVHFRRA